MPETCSHCTPVSRAVQSWPARRQGESRIGAVVEHFGRAWAGTVREEVHTHAPGSEAYRARVDAVSAQFVAAAVPQRVVGQGARHQGAMAEPAQGHGDVGFGPANMCLQAAALQQQLFAGRRKAQQHLATKTQDVVAPIDAFPTCR